MQQFDWREFNKKTNTNDLIDVKEQLHLVLQTVAAIGRKFLDPSEGDENATLSWVPGLTRLAGRWVKGNITFRASLSFKDFGIYLVDEKINVISSFDIRGKSQTQLLIWLEEQVGKLDLDASGLTLNLPYQLPEYSFDKGSPYSANLLLCSELAKYYHNSYISIRELLNKLNLGVFDIITWPHHFDQAVTIIIKETGDPETNSTVSVGFSPGDEEFDQPYFYVNSWPHINTTKFRPLKNNAVWHEESWTGAVLTANNVINSNNQKQIIDDFYYEVYSVLVSDLQS